jgi:gluconate 2-dehydrogenase alpha chain
MGAQNVALSATVPPGSVHIDWWGAHIRGGCRIGQDPNTSVWNKWNQCWTSPNYFGAGEITNTCGDNVPSGTHIAGPQSYVAAEGIQKYLKSPGILS